MSPRVIDDATRDAREQDLICTALNIISTEGVSGLTMDKLVAQVPYSKGTVYKHFSCKEDLLTALCNNSLKKLSSLFERALTFEGNSREKMLSVGFAYFLHSQLNATEFMLVISAKTPGIREKSTAKRQEQHLSLENGLMSSMLEVITLGLSSGELALQPHLSPPQIAFSLWAMSFGTIALLHQSLDQCVMRTDMVLERELVNHNNLLLDGLGWQPFTQAHNGAETLARLKAGIFAPEIARLSNSDRPES
ncbi:MAG: TetR/AcrR family transcriptional regulator [Pontibacterium sp.]